MRMDNDIVPALLATIEQEFDTRTYNSSKLKQAMQVLNAKKATYLNVNDFAIELGEILADVLGNTVTSTTLPDGKMYYNIAERILNQTLKKNYQLISNFAVDVQSQLNQAANINIKGQVPQLNQSRIDGIVERVSIAENFDDIKWILDDPIVNFSQSIVDDAIKTNAEFHFKAGLGPKITRRLLGDACDWCRQLAGTYNYKDAPENIYQRHERCRCTVEYDPKDGRGIQDSHSKVWNGPEREKKIAERKEIGIKKKMIVETSSQENVKEIPNKKNISENKKETKTEKMQRELEEMQAENKILKEALIQDYIRVRGMTLKEATNAANKITAKAQIKTKE